jgi:hypothetical protein
VDQFSSRRAWRILDPSPIPELVPVPERAPQEDRFSRHRPGAQQHRRPTGGFEIVVAKASVLCL